MTAFSKTEHDFGMGKKTLVTYSLGFFLCILLTLIPYATVEYAGYSFSKTIIHIYVAALVQAGIHIAFFLRLNWHTKQSQLNVMAFIYVIVLSIILIGGSLWIMWNLNCRMM